MELPSNNTAAAVISPVISMYRPVASLVAVLALPDSAPENVVAVITFAAKFLLASLFTKVLAVEELVAFAKSAMVDDV